MKKFNIEDDSPDKGVSIADIGRNVSESKVFTQTQEAPAKPSPKTNETWFKPTDPYVEPVPELDFIIEDFCARGMVTIIAGSPGSGKSILTQYLLSKHDNIFLPVKPKTRALYLADADASETELRRRARSIKTNMGLHTVKLPQWGENSNWCVTNESFINDLTQNVIAHQYDVVIFDTVADFHEGSTYEAEAVNKSMAVFRRFARDTDAGIILITHTKKGSKIKSEYNVEDVSDSRIWTSKSDFVFAIKSEDLGDYTKLIELQCLKSRSPRTPRPYRAEISTMPVLSVKPSVQMFKTELEESGKEVKRQKLIEQTQKLNKEGKTQREIADILGIGTGTVNKYLKIDLNLTKVDPFEPDSLIKP